MSYQLHVPGGRQYERALTIPRICIFIQYQLGARLLIRQSPSGGGFDPFENLVLVTLFGHLHPCYVSLVTRVLSYIRFE